MTSTENKKITLVIHLNYLADTFYEETLLNNSRSM